MVNPVWLIILLSNLTNMPCFRLDINGMLHGVGFSAHVHRLAHVHNVSGILHLATSGYHVHFKADYTIAEVFTQQIVKQHPPHAIILSYHLNELNDEIDFEGFVTDYSSEYPQTGAGLITPDFSLCNNCRQEMSQADHPLYQSPFIQCSQCGYRYAIQLIAPFQLHNSTWKHIQLGAHAEKAIADSLNRRFEDSFFVSLSDSLHLKLINSEGYTVSQNTHDILSISKMLLSQGNIIAVKATGGFVLLCDAAQEDSIRLLRERKNSSLQPLHLMYSDLDMAHTDIRLRPIEISALKNRAGFAVLCTPHLNTPLPFELITPVVHKAAVVLPYTGLLHIITEQFGKPLVITPAEKQGYPALYSENESLQELFELADYVISHPLDVAFGQHDSILQFTEREQKIILRRARGMAPLFEPSPFKIGSETWLALGESAESAYSIAKENSYFVYEKQGNQELIPSQQKLVHHLRLQLNILQSSPSVILTSTGYKPPHVLNLFSEAKVIEVPHQQAHFYSVLAENDLLFHSEPVLGIIWDDAFLGDDGMLGGGDIFIYEQQEMERVAHLGRFPVLTNSGMYQPRLSALGILKSMPNKMHWERRHFSDVEWQAYLSELENANLIETSSVQQLLEGIASLFGLAQVNAHRGHALLQLEQLAYTCTYPVYDYYRLPLENGQLNLKSFLIELMEDWQQKEDINVIAWKVFFSLAKVVEKLSNHYYIDHIAFSGTVFKSSLLTDMIIEQLKHKRKLYFHKQICSGSECISIGQMAYYYCLQPRA